MAGPPASRVRRRWVRRDARAGVLILPCAGTCSGHRHACCRKAQANEEAGAHFCSCGGAGGRSSGGGRGGGACRSRLMSRKGSCAVDVKPHSQHVTSERSSPPNTACTTLAPSAAADGRAPAASAGGARSPAPAPAGAAAKGTARAASAGRGGWPRSPRACSARAGQPEPPGIPEPTPPPTPPRKLFCAGAAP